MTEESQIVRRRNHPAGMPEGAAFFHSRIKALIFILFITVILFHFFPGGAEYFFGLSRHTAVLAGIMVFVYAVGSFLWLEFSSRPVLIVSTDGIFIPRLVDTVIPWSEIRDVNWQSWPWKPRIWLELREPKLFIAPSTTLKGFSMRMRAGFFSNPASLDTYLLKGGTEAAYITIERYRSEAASSSGR